MSKGEGISSSLKDQQICAAEEDWGMKIECAESETKGATAEPFF